MVNKSSQRIEVYRKALNAAWLKNQAISNNIANVNTPGYKRQDVQFESILKNHLNNSFELVKTHPKHISNSNSEIEKLEPKIIIDRNTSFRKDDNNVNIDVEMAELSKNTIKFNALSQQLTNHLQRIKMSITEGGK